MQIRRIRPDDFSAVKALLTHLMPGLPHRRRAMWDALRDHPGHGAWVAEVDDIVAGYLDQFIFPDLAHGERIAVISNLIVGEPFRGRGLGKRLLREAVEHSRRERAVEVHVWTEFDNMRAIRLYKDARFAERALLLELGSLPAGSPAPK
jgi:ribosomal protein S18 acetylase RimI-like enzyme